jgi:hypothetical protein
MKKMIKIETYISGSPRYFPFIIVNDDEYHPNDSHGERIFFRSKDACHEFFRNDYKMYFTDILLNTEYVEVGNELNN